MQRGKHLIQKSFISDIFEVGYFCSCSSGVLSLDTKFSLNSTVRRHLSSGQSETALTHFLWWQERGIQPDKFTIPSLVKLSLVRGEPLLLGEQIHCFAIKSSYIGDIFVSTSLVEMYFKYRDLEAPVRLFSETRKRDVALFTTMISEFSRNGLSGKAMGFFFKMLNEGIEPNKVTLTTMFSLCSQTKNLILGKILHGFSLRRALVMVDVILQTATMDMYAKCESLCYARRFFDRMCKRNLVTWNSIICSYFMNGLFRNALGLFKDMVLEGWRRPRSSMLSLVLNICGVTTDLRKGKEVHGYILKSNSGDISELEKLMECNSLVDMYVKSGDINSAILMFERMHKRNVVTWTIMISAYGAYGLSRKALDLFLEMKRLGTEPDGVTFISVLSACSHSGLVQEGREIFLSMTRDYNIVPDMKHFVCMVDLYGRAGLLKEAFDFIRTMPVEPSKFVWGTLLSCCRNHMNLELGEIAAKKALDLDRYDVGNYVLLSRLYADAKRWKDVAKVRVLMKELGLKTRTAYSWVEMKGKVYQFSVGDQLKVFSIKLHEFLKKAGFQSDTLAVGHNLEHEEEKVSDLCGHTEKVALAFVLMRGGGEKLIRIGKNLRVCKDCHEAFKFASKAFGREIILKDPNRYHHFSQGFCSCHDFW